MRLFVGDRSSLLGREAIAGGAVTDRRRRAITKQREMSNEAFRGRPDRRPYQHWRDLMRKLALAFTPVIASLVLAAPAFAGPIVDPNTLQPVPPNATCRDDGRQIICDTFIDEVFVNEQITDFDLPCGTIYETGHYRGDGTRWYVDRLVVKRHVAASFDGTWSLSPSGAGPTVKVSGHWSDWTIWTTPGEDSTAVVTSSSGNAFKVSAPGFGVIVHDAGLTYPDGTHHGFSAQFPFTPAVAATLCAALT
jgi:hypothetical protein